MTPSEIRELEKHHLEALYNQQLAAERMGPGHGEGFIRAGERHARWARQLGELATAMEDGTAMGAKVIKAGEVDRRELVARIATLESELAAAKQNNADRSGPWNL